MDIRRTRHYMLLRTMLKSVLRRPGWGGPIDDSAMMPHVPPVLMDWPEGVPKPRVGLVKDTDIYPYWTKFRRFLEANRIHYRLYDIHRSDWLARAAEFDLVIWRPMSFPYEMEECRRKLYVLERKLCKQTYPSFDEAMLYEDKALQYYLLKLHGLPVIDTFVSHSREEALRYMAGRSYPAVWKIATGSGSWGVELVRDAKAGVSWTKDVFSFAGRRTYWPFLRQKDYIYVQDLEPNAGFDLRVIVVGDKVASFYRDVPDGEYRASGMGLVRWGAPDRECVSIARQVAAALEIPCLAVDFLVGRTDGRPSIIELSSFTQVDLPELLRIDGRLGWLEGEDLHFVEGRAWLQELALEQFLLTRWLASRSDQSESDRTVSV
ncbi:MAG: hypothetical protein GX624_03705 [Actinobacteria bacterium]|nr:hypothetical protein [Actinomycetota bacterium]